MSRNKSRLITLFIILGIIFIILYAREPVARLLSPKNEPYFTGFDKNTVSELTVATASVSVKLYKKNNDWYLKQERLELPADQEKVQTLLTNILTIRKEEVVSSNKSKHKDLGIDKQKVEFMTKNKRYAIYIGDTSGFSKNYVRINNENDVFLASGFDTMFALEDFKDRKLHLINDEEKVTSVEITYVANFEKKKTTLTKNENIWKIGEKTAKKDRVDFFLNDLQTLKASDISPKDTNLPEVDPDLVVVVKESNKEKKADFIEKDVNNYYAKVSTSVFIFQVPAVYVASLKKEDKDFIE